MRLVVAGLPLLLLLVPRAAHAHAVPGDAEPGTSALVLPGPLATLGYRACCPSDGGNGFVDLGVEISIHRFVPSEGSVVTQPGYGALAQLSLGGVPDTKRTPDDVGTSLRFALGGEGTLGFLGTQAGLVTRIGSPSYGTSLGVFAGGFFSFGIVSAGAQIEAPFASLSNNRMAPLLVTFPFTIKWPVLEIEDRKPTSS